MTLPEKARAVGVAVISAILYAEAWAVGGFIFGYALVLAWAAVAGHLP